MCNERVLCAGFGGQGVMSMGQLLAYAGMIEDKHVTWMPSYGPEMRGGTAYCSVVVSDRPVGSPIVTTNASCAIVMNQPSLQKFERSVVGGGLILVNSSLINTTVKRSDVHAYYIPANDLARDCGNPQAANMVMLGAYLALARPVQAKNVLKAFGEVFGKNGHSLFKLNSDALRRGGEAVLGQEQTLAAA